MKTILTIITLFGLAVSGLAQTVYTKTTLTGTGLPTAATPIVASATSNTTATITCTKFEEVGIQVSFALAGAGTSDQTITFTESADGTSFATAGGGVHTLIAAGNGATKVTVCTNITVGSSGYLRLSSWANGQADRTCTNLGVIYTFKPKRNG